MSDYRPTEVSTSGSSVDNVRQLERLCCVPPQHAALLVPVAEHDAYALVAVDSDLVDRGPMGVAVNDAVDTVALRTCATSSGFTSMISGAAMSIDAMCALLPARMRSASCLRCRRLSRRSTNCTIGLRTMLRRR